MKIERHILITGSDGYIASIFKQVFEYLNKCNYTNQVKYYVTCTNTKDLEKYLSNCENTFDMIIHCGAPSSNKYDLGTIIKGVRDQTSMLIDFCVDNNALLVYPGSMVIFEESFPGGIDKYQYYKKYDDFNIRSNMYLKYLVLNFPRVYSSDRKKGLINDLRCNLVPDSDMDKFIKFCDKENMYRQLCDIFLNIDVFKFDKLSINLKNSHMLDIKGIKEKYL
jgi:nucleoside-diphosphate-sugar epimerase